MWALRTESELILKSRWVLPGILTDAGFTFAHTDLEAALTDVYRNHAASIRRATHHHRKEHQRCRLKHNLGKGDRTRLRIRTAALASFRENGYDATTIRKIADELGMSVGATNYHFPSKNHLIQELYLDVQEAHRAAAEPLLAEESRLDRPSRHRLLDRARPAHALPRARRRVPLRRGLTALPDQPTVHRIRRSPRNRPEPLRASRRGASATGLPDDIRKLLPRALVLAHLLLALFWVYDTSEGQRRTRQLLDRGLKLLGSVLPLARLPILRGALRDMLALVNDVHA